MAWAAGELGDPLEHRPRGMVEHSPCKKRAERHIIGILPHMRVSEECLDLGREQERAAFLRVIERLDTEPVPGTEEPLQPFVPDGKGPHAIEPLQASGSPLFVRVQDHFGIGF